MLPGAECNALRAEPWVLCFGVGNSDWEYISSLLDPPAPESRELPDYWMLRGHNIFPSLSPKHSLQTMLRRRNYSEGSFPDLVRPNCTVQSHFREGLWGARCSSHPPVSVSKGDSLGFRVLGLLDTAQGCFVLCPHQHRVNEFLLQFSLMHLWPFPP